MKHFFDQTPETLRALCDELGLPAYAPSQMLEWVYRRGVSEIGAMTDISRANRAKLAERLFILRGVEVAHQVATDGTQKLLVAWPEVETVMPAQAGIQMDRSDQDSHLRGNDDATNNEPRTTNHSPLTVFGSQSSALPPAPQRATECVMIPDERRRTACVSSQVGCPVGCAFCASGIGGLEGNLTRGQIVEQVFRLTRRLPPPSSLREGARGWVQPIEIQSDDCSNDWTHPLTPSLRGRGKHARISHIVFMGMGEPLANFAAVTGAVRTLHASWGYGISARRITISTVGLPEAIRKLVNFDLPVTLALSLHAPNDELRRRLIPWASYTTIVELLDACDEYFQKTGREITLEYILLRHVNDRPEHAQELATIAKRLRSNVNLIRYNEVRGLPFERPATEDVRRFQEILRARGVNAHIRKSRGRDIAAACGQLRHERQRVAQ
jgi:23S rRNA (adenine2503-C2)-methyltransferase